MNPLFAIGIQDLSLWQHLVEQFGWVLVHSVWQFALLGIAMAILLRSTQANSASLRYGLLIVALAISVVIPGVTWSLQGQAAISMPPNEVAHRANPNSNSTVKTTRTVSIPEASGVEDLLESGATNDEFVQNSVSDSRRLANDDSNTWLASVQNRVRPFLGWTVAVWIVGAMVCSLRPLLGWRMLRRLRRWGISAAPDEVTVLMIRVCGRFGFRRAISIAQSTLAQAPILIGYLRPVILLPIGLITSIPPSQLEAILAHELAHARRHDFVVNLMQTVIETLFFYHPVIWWLSYRIRVEREHCCDDLVVKLFDNRIEYGRALVAIAELGGHSTHLALAASDGQLLSRVRRIFGLSQTRVKATDQRLSVAGGMVSFAAILMGVFSCNSATNTTGQPSQTAASQSVEGRSESPTHNAVAGQSIDSVVVDKATGNPIEGATLKFIFRESSVRAIREGSSERFEAFRGKPVVTFTLKNVGRFTLALPGSLDQTQDYFVECLAEHPDCQKRRRELPVLSALWSSRNAENSPFRKIELDLGKVVTGQVLNIDGTPAAKIPIFSGLNRQGWQNGNEHTTETDSQGRFRLVVPDHGRGRIYVTPLDAAAVSRAITPTFGEQPVFRLQAGTRISGTVKDKNGNAIAGVVVRADAGERIPWRFDVTDDQGEYTLPPCHYGNFRIELVNKGRFPGLEQPGIELPDVFLPKMLDLPKSAPAEQTVDFQPIESVRVTARYLTTDDQPVSGGSLTLRGGLQQIGWWGQMREVSAEPGLYEIRVPRGLSGRLDHFDAIPSDKHFLRVSEQLGTNQFDFESDEPRFVVRRVKSGRLTLRLTSNGKPLARTDGGIHTSARFIDQQAAHQIGAIDAGWSWNWKTDRPGEISIPLQPGFAIECMLKFAGYTAWTDIVTLEEGEERVLEVELQPETTNEVARVKRELIDAISRAHFHKVILDRLNGATGLVSKRTVVEAQGVWQSDVLAIEKAERTLRSWNLTEEEIEAVRKEARDLIERTERKGDSVSAAPSGGANGQAPAVSSSNAGITQEFVVKGKKNVIEQRITNELEQPSSISVTDDKLLDVIFELKERHQIPIFIDVKALTDAGVDSKTRVTLVLSNVKLGEILERLLEGCGLKHTVRDNIVAITSAADVQEQTPMPVENGATNAPSAPAPPAAPRVPVAEATQAPQPAKQVARKFASEEEVPEAVRALMPSIVSITRRSAKPNSPVGQHKGVVVDDRGYILTNSWSTARDLEEITVRLPDGTEYSAESVEYDSVRKMEILRIRPDNPIAALPPITPHTVKTGDNVIAVTSSEWEELLLGPVTHVGISQGESFPPNLTVADFLVDLGSFGSLMISEKGEPAGIWVTARHNSSKSGPSLAIPLVDVMPLLKKAIPPQAGAQEKLNAAKSAPAPAPAENDQTDDQNDLRNRPAPFDPSIKFAEAQDVPEAVRTLLPTIVHVSRRNNEPNSTPLESAGVVVDSRGYVLTMVFANYPDRNKITVRLSDNTEYKAAVVASDTVHHMQLLRIYPEKPITALPPLTPQLPKAGDTVIAVTSPKWDDLIAGVATGSGKFVHETFPPNLLEAGFMVRPGSGGSLMVTERGEPVGIWVGMRASKPREFGPSYAVPIVDVMPFLKIVLPESVEN